MEEVIVGDGHDETVGHLDNPGKSTAVKKSFHKVGFES